MIFNFTQLTLLIYTVSLFTVLMSSLCVIKLLGYKRLNLSVLILLLFTYYLARHDYVDVCRHEPLFI